MTPTISSEINVTTKKIKVTDTFNYTTIPSHSGVYGNFTIKRGNTVIHTNEEFDENSDIVIGVNTSKEVDLPTSSGKVLDGSYSVKYDINVLYEIGVTAPESGTFNHLTTSVLDTEFLEAIDELLSAGKTPIIEFMTSGGTVLGSSIVTETDGYNVIYFGNVTIGSYNTIAKVTIYGEYDTTKYYTFNNCNVVEKLSMNMLVNCFTAQITVQDTTQYPSYVETLTRSLILRYPRKGDGSEVEPAVETSSASITVGAYIWSGGYTANLQSVMGWTQTDGLLISQTLTEQINKDVRCDVNLCNASKCIRTLSEKYLEAVKNGDRNSHVLFQQNFTVLLLTNNYQLALTCQDSEAAASALSSLSDYLKLITDGACSCGCSGGESNEPKRIYPIFSSESLINGIENTINYQ